MMPRADDDFTDEITSHIALEAERLVAEGWSPLEAQAAARRRFGNVTSSRERFYESRRVLWLEDMRKDARHAVRMLVRNPGFAAIAILTLALGIGATTAIFSVVDHVLFRPLPYPAADRLVRLYESNATQDPPRRDPSVANAVDWRAASRAFEAMTLTGATSRTLTGAGEPEQLPIMMAGRGFFDVFGERLLLGRPFAPEEYDSAANAALGNIALREQAAGPAAIIISEALWRRQFGADPQVVGRRVALDGHAATVVGVMAADFQFDQAQGGAVEGWVPLVERSLTRFRRFRQFITVGRLAPGVGLEAAQEEMNGIARALESRFPGDNAGWSIQLTSLYESVVGGSRRVMLILLAGVACVLLIACANIASLLLMRAAGRTREFALRTALGAGRGRLARQWLVESVVLYLAGAALAFLVARLGLPLLIEFAPPSLPRLDEVTIDSRVLVVATAMSLAAGVASGLVLALAAHADTVVGILKGWPAISQSSRLRWVRQTLVAAELALAVVLLVGAGLMLRTVVSVQSLQLGFSPDRVLTFGVSGLSGERYRTLAAHQLLSGQVVDRLQRLDGVEAAGLGAVPLRASLTNGFEVEEGSERHEATTDIPNPGYFHALRIRLLDGRTFLDSDGPGAEAVAIVNQRFARQAWGREDVVGRRLRPTQGSPWLRVVGVVADLRMSSLEADAPALVYLPSAQSRIATFSNFVVRTTGDPRRIESAIRAIVRDLDSSLALTRVATMDDLLADAIAPRAFNMWLLGLYSIVAVVLAVVGVYGLLSEAVASRTAEIGIRMALGAERRTVRALVLRQGLVLAAVGVGIGLAGAVGLTRYVEGLLFGVTPLDRPTFVVVPVLLVVVALAAAYVPARRATRIDPLSALRCE